VGTYGLKISLPHSPPKSVRISDTGSRPHGL
jgi:hypothetical protein